MKLVYDLPLRLFHGVLTVGLVAGYCLAEFTAPNSRLFPYHILTGLFLVWVVGLRVIWGLTGSHHSRWSSLPLGPKRLFEYGRNLFTNKSPMYLGHNPASAWAGVLLMTLTVALAITGLLMTLTHELAQIEELHELLAHAFLLVAGAHVAGVTLHSIRHRDSIWLAMWTGRKKGPATEPSIQNDYRIAGLIFFLLLLFGAFFLLRHYDPATGILSVFGNLLAIGEAQ